MNGSVSAEAEFTPLDRLGLVFGASYHWIDGDQSIDDSEYSYLLAAHYALTADWGTKLSWSRKVRAPSIRNLYDEARGNLDLKYEVIDAYEGGINYQPESDWSAELSVFRMDVEDFIERNEVTDLFDNVDESQLQGVELSGVVSPLEQLVLRGAYSYLDSEDETDSGRDELQNRPRHMFVADLDWNMGYNLGTHLKVRHVADQVYYSRNPPLIQADLNDYTVVDARLRWRPLGSLEMHVAAENLFDENFEEEYGLPNPGRFVYVGFQWSL